MSWHACVVMASTLMVAATPVGRVVARVAFVVAAVAVLALGAGAVKSVLTNYTTVSAVSYDINNYFLQAELRRVQSVPASRPFHAQNGTVCQELVCSETVAQVRLYGGF